MGLDITKANKTTEFTNLSVSKIIGSKAVGKDIKKVKTEETGLMAKPGEAE